MIFLRLLPVILSFLILGAHFSRLGLNSLAVLSLVCLFMLFLKKAWIPRLFQVLLILAALEWIRSLYFYADAYSEYGQSTTRLFLIMGGVALFTGLSALVFRNKKLRDRYVSPK